MGVVLTMTMVITTLLLHVVTTDRWKWPLPIAVLVNGTSTQTFVITNSTDAGITATGVVSVGLEGVNTGDFRIARNTWQ